MEDFVPTVALAALVIAGVNFFKAIRNKNTNAWFTQLVVWAVGVGVILLVAQTDFATGIVIYEDALSDLNAWSQVFVGLTLGSTALVINEFKKALDNSDSAAKPPFIKE